MRASRLIGAGNVHWPVTASPDLSRFADTRRALGIPFPNQQGPHAAVFGELRCGLSLVVKFDCETRTEVPTGAAALAAPAEATW